MSLAFTLTQAVMSSAIDVVNSGLLALQPPPPVDLTPLTSLIVSWIVKIVGSIAVIFLVLSLVGQLDPAKRDLRAAGMEIIGTLALIAVISKSTDIVTALLATVGVK